MRLLTELLVLLTPLERGEGMTNPEDNIKTILADWLYALHRHDSATVERRMDPEVFWQGVRKDFVCTNREEAMEMLREEHGVEALELIATEEKVVLGYAAPNYRRSGACHLAARSSRSSRCALTTAGSSGRRVPSAQRGTGGGRCRRARKLALGVTGLGPRRAPGLCSYSYLREIWKLVSRRLRNTLSRARIRWGRRRVPSAPLSCSPICGTCPSHSPPPACRWELSPGTLLGGCHA